MKTLISQLDPSSDAFEQIDLQRVASGVVSLCCLMCVGMLAVAAFS